MKTALRSISAREFDSWEPALKVIAHDHARRFAAIATADDKREVVISWRGEAIEPVRAVGAQSEVWIGVDQRLACVAADGRIVVSIGLASSLLEIRCLKRCVAVLCETEVTLFNADYSIRSVRSVPELPSRIAEDGGAFVVTLDDGSEVKIG